MTKVYEPKLKTEYHKKIVPALLKELKLKNTLQVPRLTKIVLNMGVGDAVADLKLIQWAKDDLAAIAGQKPIATKAKKSVAAFKLRKGMPIGVMVTLRKDRMYEFLDRVLTVAMPRQRDFRGLNPKAFDGNGNYSFGLREQIVFPEIDYDKVGKIRGLQVVICTTAKTNTEAKKLLHAFGMPF